MTRFTLHDIQSKLSAGKIRGYSIPDKKVKGVQVVAGGENVARSGKKTAKSEQIPHKQMAHIIGVLENLKVEYRTEYEFDDVRKFRFDVAILHLMLAVEYEGVGSKVSRHTTRKGYMRDCEKYTLAAVNGWRVLRYTYKDYKNFESDLKAILK